MYCTCILAAGCWLPAGWMLETAKSKTRTKTESKRHTAAHLPTPTQGGLLSCLLLSAFATTTTTTTTTPSPPPPPRLKTVPPPFSLSLYLSRYIPTLPTTTQYSSTPHSSSSRGHTPRCPPGASTSSHCYGSSGTPCPRRRRRTRRRPRSWWPTPPRLSARPCMRAARTGVSLLSVSSVM